MLAQLGDGACEELPRRLDTLEVDLQRLEAVAGIVAEQVEPDCLSHTPRVVQPEVVLVLHLVARAYRGAVAPNGVAGVDGRSWLGAEGIQGWVRHLYGRHAV